MYKYNTDFDFWVDVDHKVVPREQAFRFVVLDKDMWLDYPFTIHYPPQPKMIRAEIIDDQTLLNVPTGLIAELVEE